MKRERTPERESARNDVKMLKRACLALEATSPRMRRATLAFLWDKYIAHPTPPPLSGDGEGKGET